MEPPNQKINPLAAYPLLPQKETNMVGQELQHRFQYHEPDYPAKESITFIHKKALDLAEAINSRLCDCREKSIAMTSIEDAVLWATKGIEGDLDG